MRRYALLSVWSLTLWGVTLGLAGASLAQTPPAVTGPPDVLVLVYQRPGLGDQVDITYARTVPHDQVTRDLQALTTETGWTIPLESIKDAAAPVRSHDDVMTSAAFTAPNVVQNETHTLPMETFARAFRNYKRLNLVFIVSSGFTFQGTRQSADNQLQFTLDQHGAAYTYQIAILNPNFGGDGLTAARTAASSHPRVAPWLVFLGILGLAALVGVLVFVVTVRLTPPPAGPKPPQDLETEERSEESLPIGTRG